MSIQHWGGKKKKKQEPRIRKYEQRRSTRFYHFEIPPLKNFDNHVLIHRARRLKSRIRQKQFVIWKTVHLAAEWKAFHSILSVEISMKNFLIIMLAAR